MTERTKFDRMLIDCCADTSTEADASRALM